MSENKIEDAVIVPQAPVNMKLPTPVLPKLDLPPLVNVPQSSHTNMRPDGEGLMNIMPVAEGSTVTPPADGKARIMIGIPLLDIKYEFFESFMKFMQEVWLTPESRYEIGYHIAYRKPVHMAEEYLVSLARHNKCTHILLMDDDIYDIKKADLDKLFEADKDFISGVMHASKFPHAMCVFRRFNKGMKVIDMPADNSMFRLYEVPCNCTKCGVGISHWDAKYCMNCGAPQDNMIQQADLTPFPFTLIKMSVFDRIDAGDKARGVVKPWFHCTNKYPTDSWFADRLEENGMTMYAHMGVRLNHAGITDATKPYYLQMGQAKAMQARAVVNLTPEQMDMHQYLLHTKMQQVEGEQRSRPVFAQDGKAVANADKLSEKELTLVTHGT
jgi:hypothetical protein